jgi:hypothetical protein
VLIKIDPDQLRVAGLLLAEHITGAPKVKVTGADREACSKPIKCLKGVQPRESPRRDVRTRLCEEQDLTAACSTANPATQLMKL